MRIALGCMRLSTEPGRDEARALATMRAALAAGIRTFDTARAYGLDENDAGHNERLIATVRPPRVITKCGMRRDGGAWSPDGRASRIAEDVEASLAALGGVPIDTLLLHAHTALGGPARAPRLARDQVLSRVGARRPETIASLVVASRLGMEEDELVAIDERFPVLGAMRRPPRRLDEASREGARALAEELTTSVSRIVEIAFCTHPAGPPVCWCRPPLPGLWLAFARRHGVDVRESTLVGTTAADRALAQALGLPLREP